MISLGVDVGGLRKGLDAVALDNSRRIVLHERWLSAPALGDLIRSLAPDVVAIDSPPAWAVAAERKTETAVRRRGLHLYQTPWQESKKVHAFYAWMVHGFEAHRAAREHGYPLYAGEPSVAGRSLEVFPHAIATVLAGHLRPPSIPKPVWRRSILLEHVPHTGALRSPDQVDAALAALAGVLALEGCFCWEGDVTEGVIILPCAEADLLPRYSVDSVPALLP